MHYTCKHFVPSISGGTLGLFTGASILSFVEIFYWMVILVKKLLNTLRSAGNKDVDPEKGTTKPVKKAVVPKRRSNQLLPDGVAQVFKVKVAK